MPTTPIPFKPEDYKDRTGTWKPPVGVIVPIICKDARRAYGRIELLITPEGGEGEAWVQASYVTLSAKPIMNIELSNPGPTGRTNPSSISFTE